MGMKSEKKEVLVAGESDVASARRAGEQLAEQAGLDTTQKYCVMTSISELAANILNHAGQGNITVRVVSGPDGNTGLEVVARDEGPGIADTDLAMQDGYSSTGTLGGGLPGVNRMMSEMELSSTPGKGTLVRAVKWMDEPQSLYGTPAILGRLPLDHIDGTMEKRRKFKRFDVTWHGRCKSDDATITGSIKNVSEKGIFFQPGIDADGREAVNPGEAPSIFVEGGSWMLSLVPGRGVEPLVVKATVRWVGYHLKLACEGIGFEFESRVPEIALMVP